MVQRSRAGLRGSSYRHGYTQQADDLVVLWEAALALLGEHNELPVGDDVMLALLALDRGGLVPRGVQHGRETRGPAVVAVSDRRRRRSRRARPGRYPTRGR